MQPFGSYGSSYAYGNCTWYVASRIAVPAFMGNANQWGYVLGYHSEPILGAIAWTTSGWAGHVAIVENVYDGYVTVSEMNYAGFDYIDYRDVPTDQFLYLY